MKKNELIWPSVARAILLLASVIVADDVRAVTQIHMAQGRDPTSMTISWITPLDLSHVAASEVHYGTSPTDLSMVAVGYSSYYTTNYYNQPQYTSGQLHHTVLTALTPGTTYFYSCGDFSDQNQPSSTTMSSSSSSSSSPSSSSSSSSSSTTTSSTHSPYSSSRRRSLLTSGVESFRTLPAVGATDVLTFGVIGDLGQVTFSGLLTQTQIHAVSTPTNAPRATTAL